MHRASVAEFRRQIAPSGGTTRQPQDGVKEQPVVSTRAFTVPALPGTKGSMIAHCLSVKVRLLKIAPPFSILNQTVGNLGRLNADAV